MTAIDKFCAPGVFDPTTYSQGIRVAHAQTLLFLSGQVAYTPDGGVACRGDFKGQARGAYDAIKALVESQGGTMANVIKITTRGSRGMARLRACSGSTLTCWTGISVPLVVHLPGAEAPRGERSNYDLQQRLSHP